MYIKKSTFIGLIVISTITLFAVVFVVAQSILSSGQPVPNYLNYQGRLIDPNTGQPTPDGNHSVTFHIYDAETGGSPKGGPYTSNVTTQNGLFNTLIGPVESSVFDGSDRWIEIEVNGETISTRQRIVSVAYAIRATNAENADTIEGHPASDFTPASHQDIPHMEFISSTDMGFASDIPAPSEANVAILNVNWRAYAHANVGWVDADDVFILLKTGASSLTIAKTVGVSLYTVNVKFTLSWSDNLIRISTDGAEVSQDGGTAYFYR